MNVSRNKGHSRRPKEEHTDANTSMVLGTKSCLFLVLELFNVLTHPGSLVFLTGSSPEVEDLPGNMQRMSLSPERHRKPTRVQAATSNGLGTTSDGTSTQGASSSRTLTFPFEASQFQFTVPTATSTLTPPRKRVAPVIKFVEPTWEDILLRGAPDSSVPHINPWAEDYFLGDVY